MYPVLAHGDRILVLRHYPGWRLSVDQIIICDLAVLDTYLKSKRDIESFAGLELGLLRNEEVSRPSNDAPRVMPYIVKRLVGLPGNTVVVPISEVPGELRASVNGKCDEQGNLVWNVPPGYCFVRGDWLYSFDSVIVGPIPLTVVSGIMIKKLRRKDSGPNPEPSPPVINP